ncbi:hypothetical protein Tco_0084853 [Tanacetum coccineum]
MAEEIGLCKGEDWVFKVFTDILIRLSRAHQYGYKDWHSLVFFSSGPPVTADSSVDSDFDMFGLCLDFAQSFPIPCSVLSILALNSYRPRYIFYGHGNPLIERLKDYGDLTSRHLVRRECLLIVHPLLYLCVRSCPVIPDSDHFPPCFFSFLLGPRDLLLPLRMALSSLWPIFLAGRIPLVFRGRLSGHASSLER